MTFQTVSNLFESSQPLLFALAHAGAHVEWRRRLVLDLTLPSAPSFQTQYTRVVRSLLPDQQVRASRSLGEILCAYNHWEGHDRVRFVKRVAERIAGRVVPVHLNATRNRWSFQALKGAIQQWVIAHLDESSLEMLCQRLAIRTH